MANEGLDIPTLNCLVLSTPKSDIIQSVGRIDRVIHKNIQPLVIDYVDKFSIFDGQSKKRFMVYKKKKYQIDDIQYDLDKLKLGITKSYSFHNCKNSSSESDIDDLSIDEIEIDTEYKNIDPKTNKKIKNEKNKITNKKDIVINKEMNGKDIDKLFNNYMFSS
jgi:superfamily II DNA or RNA helicase